MSNIVENTARSQRLAEINAEYDRLVDDPSTDPEYRQQLIDLEPLYKTPPKDRSLADVWFTYGPFYVIGQQTLTPPSLAERLNRKL